jgi:hypothetical protein
VFRNVCSMVNKSGLSIEFQAKNNTSNQTVSFFLNRVIKPAGV